MAKPQDENIIRLLLLFIIYVKCVCMTNSNVHRILILEQRSRFLAMDLIFTVI